LRRRKSEIKGFWEVEGWRGSMRLWRVMNGGFGGERFFWGWEGEGLEKESEESEYSVSED
jgi:hypothetical protein